MARLIILRGLPASGRSTRARSWCKDPANTWLRYMISFDGIRLMTAGSAQVQNWLQSEYDRRFNGMVVAMEWHTIADVLDVGQDVVTGVQHANPRYAAGLALLAQRHGALWEARDLSVPLDELLCRNVACDTADRVLEDYIRSSWKHFHTTMLHPLRPGDPNGNLLERMRVDPYTRITLVRGETDVYTCNFTTEAFHERRWTDRIINTRGLFTGGNGQVMQRGFEKFLAVDEMEETSFAQVVNRAQGHLESLSVRVERKENGFFGLVGTAGIPGLFRFWSKSGQVDYSALIERPSPSDSAVRAELWCMLHEWNATAAFEAVDRESDRHIVGYGSSGLCLLHLIHNVESFSIDAAHEETLILAGGFVWPETVAICHSSEEVVQAIGDIKTGSREDVVLYFVDDWMVKVRSGQYKLVKVIHPLI